MGSFRALEMILSCGLDLAAVTGGWVGAGWLEDTVPAAGGDGRFTAEMTVGSTLTTGVEAASGGPFKTTDTSSHTQPLLSDLSCFYGHLIFGKTVNNDRNKKLLQNNFSHIVFVVNLDS